MSLRGQYVKDDRGIIGMVESEEIDIDGRVLIYYGVQDRVPVRGWYLFDLLVPIDPPRNARVNGDIPPADQEEIDKAKRQAAIEENARIQTAVEIDG